MSGRAGAAGRSDSGDPASQLALAQRHVVDQCLQLVEQRYEPG
jgi:hypothetical protein